MSIQRRRRLRFFWPHGCHWGSWHHPMSPYGPPPGWGWGRPTPEEEKEYLDEYIEMLKEELAAAEEYRKELEESD
jgi:hypothetical protein